jgi:hypothetical protein
MSFAAVAIGTSVAGMGLNYMGARKQAKENRRTQDANAAADAEAQRQNWARYLMQRGIDPGAGVETGAVPINARAINTRLPLWMNVSRASPTAAPMVSGSAIPARAVGVVRRKAGV